MMNPMANLTVISIVPFKKDFYWKLWYGCNGGFIGLNDFNNQYNVWSTPVEYDLDKLIKMAERVHQKILSNIDVFKNHMTGIDESLELYKDSDKLEDFEVFESKVKLFEKWVNE